MKKQKTFNGVLGIDPGLKGALVFFDGVGKAEFFEMPVSNGRVDFDSVHELIYNFPKAHIFLERAAPMAMGAKHAFNYGRDFAALENAIFLLFNSFTMVEPNKWAKEMHQGISNNLKPKAKSEIAVKRLFPKLIRSIPKTPRSKKLHDGMVDALLIAAYGCRVLMKT